MRSEDSSGAVARHSVILPKLLGEKAFDMILRSWLANLVARLTFVSARPNRRRRSLSLNQTVTPNHVEMLEQRQMLTAALTGLEATALTYMEHSTPPSTNPTIPLSSAITATDSTATVTTATSATIRISAGYQSGEDVLSYVGGPATITASPFSNGTIVLTSVAPGGATLGDFTAALQSLYYHDSAATPSQVARTVTFAFTDPSGPSPAVTRNITFVNDNPVLTGLETTPLTYLQHSNPPNLVANNDTPISSAITVTESDPSVTTVTGAIIQFTPGTYISTEDNLVFQNTTTIIGSWDAATGKLTLSGTDTLANYTAALQSVAYYNSSKTPNTNSQRVVTYTVSNADGSSTSVSRSILITAVDSNPVVTGTSTLGYVDHALVGYPIIGPTGVAPSGPDSNNATILSPTIAVTSPDPAAEAPDITSATIKFSSGSYKSDQDQLIFNNTPKITGSWNSATGTLTLSGDDTLANYTTALQNVYYQNTMETAAPNTSTRTVSFTVTDSYGYTSASVTQSITLTHKDDAPVLGMGPTEDRVPINYVEPSIPGSTPLTISSTITASDPDTGYLQGVVIQISGGAPNEDQLLFTKTSTIGGTWNFATETLTLSGVDTLLAYSKVLRTIQYSDLFANPTPTPRIVTYAPIDNTTVVGGIGLQQVSTPAGISPSVFLASRTIIMVPIDGPPVLTNLESTPLHYPEHSAPPLNTPLPVTSAIQISDPEIATLESATVQITGNYQLGEDQLIFNNATFPKISGTWNIATGTMTLTGVDTLTNYQAALQAVEYEDLAASPNPINRTLTFQATDDLGTASQTVNRTIVMVPTASIPTLVGLETTPLNYVDHALSSTPTVTNNIVPISGSISVVDPGTAAVQSATIQITGNYQSGEDQLIFTNTSNITGFWDASTGTLKLSGVDTLANYTAALKSVQYTDLSQTPNTAQRTVSYTVTDINNQTNTVVPTRLINVTATDDPPVLTGLETVPLLYLQQTPAAGMPVTSTINVTDPDSANLQGAAISISAGYQSGEDKLLFTNTPKITGVWNGTTGTLLLIGVDTVANYAAALQSVSYIDTSTTPNTAVRTLSFQVTDSAGLSGLPVTRSIDVIPISSPPVLTNLETTPISYTAQSTPKVSATITVNDSLDLESATIVISGGYQAGEDKLLFTNTAKIGATWNATSGTLTLSGVDTVVNYTAALRAVSYTDTAANPNPTVRTLSFTATDDTGLTGAAVTRSIVQVPSASPPVLTGLETTPLNYQDHPFVSPLPATNNVTPVSAAITVTDPSTGNLLGATVQITGNYHGAEDQLVFVNTATITGTWNAATGTLTLTGSDTLANYTAALRSVSYTDISATPNTSLRTVSFVATDADGLSSTAVTRTITVTAVDDPPVLTGVETGPLSYTAHTSPAITGTITVTDSDSVNLESATIQITGNYQATEDKLLFTNTAKIGATWNATSGTLTLSGVDTVVNYTAALRAVSYTDTAANPNPTVRTLSFTATDDTGLTGAAVTRSIVQVPSASPPVLTGLETTPLNYQDHPFVSPLPATNNVTPVSAAITVTDPSTGNLLGATVQITGNYHGAEDQLVFVNTATITGTWNAATGTLTLTGSDTLANYTAALRSVSYTDISATPNTSLRTVSFVATDADGLSSTAVTRTITVTAVDDPPVLTGVETGPLSYTAHTSPAITGTITVTDSDSVNLESATIQITGNYQATEDKLLFTNTAKIGATWNATSGTLTLTGVDTLANYTAALRAVSYTDTAAVPSTLVRTLTFQVTDDSGLTGAGAAGAAVTRSIIITPVNVPPVLVGLETTPLNYLDHAFVSPTPPLNNITPISAAITATDTDTGNLLGATIQITANYHSAEDQLVFVNTATITGSWNAANGTLTLTGNDTLANYTTALRTVSYTDTSATPNQLTRTVAFTITDANGLSSTAVTRTITVTAVDDPPVLTGLEATPLSYFELASPVGPASVTPVTAAITAADPDSALLESATVQITGNYQAGEDKLVFTNTPKIGAVWNATNGTLTLSGVDTLANYTTALRAVSYTDTAAIPNPLQRTLTFQTTDSSGLPSATVTRGIVMIPVAVPPVLSGIPNTPLNYVDHPLSSTPSLVNNVTPITPAITVGDLDTGNITSATVQITVNYQIGEDVLVYPNVINKISGTFNAATGTLTLTGTDTLANYTLALESISYTNTNIVRPNPLTRTVSFQVTDDRGLSSTIGTRDLVEVHSDDPPVLSSIETTPLFYIEGTTNQPITNTIAIADPDSLNGSGAVIQITGNYLSNQDKLQFTNTPKITGTWIAGSGTLVLTGTDTLANYQAALQAVDYVNTSQNPSVVLRTVTFQILDDKSLASLPVSRTIDVIPVDNPPVLTGLETTTLSYVDHAFPPASPVNNITPISAAITVTDPDSLNLQGATVQITGNYQSNQDQLVFTNTLTITGTWNPTTGTLTLSGIDTLANYTAALQSVSYTDTSLTPSLLTRTVSFKATDDSGVTGAAVTRTITVAHNDDPPALTGLESTSLTYTENISSFATVPLTNTLVASDPDSTNAEKATVQITGGYLNGQDQLLFTNTTKIAGSWNATNGTLTLTGVDTFANYQAALRSITYENLSHNPSSATRTVSFQTTDDQGLLSPIVTRTITVVPVNNPSVLASSLTTLSYGEGTGAKPINPAVTVSDVDSTTLASAVITLTNYVSTEDVLGFVANAGTMGNIAISSNSNGVLTLTSAGATATLAQWQTALRAVTYTNTSGDLAPTPRTATIVVNDGGSANATSNTLTTTINIAVYFPPVLSGSSTLGYVEQNPAMAINKTILVTDASSATLASATITITNFVTGQDVLGFVNDGATMGNIALQSNTGGVLTLTSAGSTATLAQWQAALQAVTYLNSSLNPSAVTRNVTFQVNSGTTVNNLSNIASSTITVTPVNNPPALSDTLDATALSYTENSTAVAVAPNIFVGDPDSTNLMGATIKIIGNDNYQGSQDTLAFTNTAKITGTWSASTGTLTLTGTDTVADYQAALRSITFSNKLDGTSAPSRTVSFTVIDDTHLTSNTFTRTINLTTVDSPPVLTGIETTPKIYNLNDPFNRYGIITSTLTLTDSDSTMMSGATAQITGNYNASQDKLSFNISGTAITGSWNGTTGTLTLTGNDTTANYQAALRTLEYYNFTGTTAGPNRTVSITVMDSSHVASNTVTRVIQLETTNTPPTLAINSTGTLNYTEGTAAVAIAPAATVTDPDSQMLQGATITISGNYQLNQDQLVFVTLGNIKGVFQPTTGSLVLQGADTVSNYQAAIQSVKYIDTSTNPSTVTRTISFTVTDGLATSNVGTRSVTVTPVDNPPLITNSSTALAYKPANGAVVVAPTVTVTDPDSAMLTGATVQVSFNYQRGNDVLSFVNTTNIKGNFNATTGILTLTGTDTVANYRLALQSIKYQFVGTATTMTKMVSFQATDGQLWSNIASQTINVTP